MDTGKMDPSGKVSIQDGPIEVVACGDRTRVRILDDTKDTEPTFRGPPPCDFHELHLLRHVEPSMIEYLELKRLTNFRVRMIPTQSHYIHLYEAVPSNKTHADQPRYFMRIIARPTLAEDFSEMERHFVAGLNTLEVVLQSIRGGNNVARNMILLTAVGEIEPSWTAQVAELQVKKLAKRYEPRLAKNKVCLIEFRFCPMGEGGSLFDNVNHVMPLRVVVDNPTGQAIRVRTFYEVLNPVSGEWVFSAVDKMQQEDIKDYEGQPIELCHQSSSPLDQKRSLAAQVGTVYIYDFLGLFEEAVKDQWNITTPAPVIDTDDGDSADGRIGSKVHSRSNPSVVGLPFLLDGVLSASEMILKHDGELEFKTREPGMNNCGMVAWLLVMRTPHFPKGRAVVVIGNDVTYQMGTFGVQEDLLYQRASEYARAKGIPRIYIACNSGARMGLATEVQQKFKVEWIDDANPSRGFRYLYITEEDHKQLKNSVNATAVTHPTHGRIYRISDIIGQQVGIGVENLCGSGAIAGETSRSYSENFTLTFVTGRSVGIGAYITRLGHRVIQKTVHAPILLTGFQALNRLIGRDVYTSNDEMGGVDIMHKNGVSHLTCKDDIEGCKLILRWLSYIPEHRDRPLPILPDRSDPINRSVSYTATSSTEDPRLMLTGCSGPSGEWCGGLFDRDSFFEVMTEWAKSVICGRARLGGIPLGVVCVETRVTEYHHPADPAMPTTSEIKLTRAGQVWYPDSAYKTAQAITDINKEQLPLIILANWRGFSGGQRDMFNEILKFGSFIVDALVEFTQPCLVYIPPKAELRGGAWVVVDPRINQNFMEMHASTDCRGGVLEPTGTVEIKYREKALIETATRLDPVLLKCVKEDSLLAKEGLPIDSPQRQDLKELKDKRLQDILPVYKQIALHFADLHDTSVRMKRRGAITEIVPWDRSRVYFYWRLKRHLLMHTLRAQIISLDPSYSIEDAQKIVGRWAEKAGVPQTASDAESNYQFVQWATNSAADIAARFSALRAEYITRVTSDFAAENFNAVRDGIAHLDPKKNGSYQDGRFQFSRQGTTTAMAALRCITNHGIAASPSMDTSATPSKTEKIV